MSTEVARDAEAVETAIMKSSDGEMARALVASGFFPNIKSASQALVKVQAGRELGFGPVASMMGIHVWTQGQGENRRVSIQLSANMIGNLVRRGGYDFEVRQHTDEACTIAFFKAARHIGTSTFTLADAQRGGLATKDVWKSYPRNMLFAAALRNGAKWFCAEVLLGAPIPVVPETDQPAGGDATDMETGEIIEGEAVPVVTAPPEGFAINWPAFWVECKAAGSDKALVHKLFGVPEENGALAAWVEAKCGREGKTPQQVVAELRAELPARLAGYRAGRTQESLDRQNAPYARKRGTTPGERAVQAFGDAVVEATAARVDAEMMALDEPDPEPDPLAQTPQEIAEIEAQQAALLPPDPARKAHP